MVRALTGSNLASAVAFIVLIFSGEASYWLNQVYTFSVIMYVPWLLFLGIQYFRRQTIRRALALTVMLGISVNTYYPSYLITFVVTLFVLAVILYRDLFKGIDFRLLFFHALLALPDPEHGVCVSTGVDPQSGQVLIRVHAFGLNRSELHFRSGQAWSGTFPRIPGIEAAGAP